jgi:hypothetical protein
MAKSAKPETYLKIVNDGLAQPQTPDESEDQKLGIKIKTLLKGDDCELHVRSYIGASGRFEPDALVLFGPTDSMMDLGADGRITLCTGKRTKERGAGSGKLNINANGGLHVYNYPTTITYNTGGDTEPKYAIGVTSYGNYEEETLGERHIRATKLYINATDIIITAGSSIHIQSGVAGKSGSIKMTAGRFEQDFINEDKILFGQKTQIGAGEDTSIAYDPRSTTTLTSAGTLQHRVTGDYKVIVAGVMATSVYGASPTGMTGVPLITDRTHGYSLDVLIGKTRILSRVGSIDISSLGISGDAKFDPRALLDLPIGAVNISALTSVGISSTTGGVSVNAGAALGASIPAGLNLISRDVLNATSTGIFSATTAGAMNLIAVGQMLIKATGNVKVQGALIYLN